MYSACGKIVAGHGPHIRPAAAGNLGQQFGIEGNDATRIGEGLVLDLDAGVRSLEFGNPLVAQPVREGRELVGPQHQFTRSASSPRLDAGISPLGTGWEGGGSWQARIMTASMTMINRRKRDMPFSFRVGLNSDVNRQDAACGRLPPGAAFQCGALPCRSTIQPTRIVETMSLLRIACLTDSSSIAMFVRVARFHAGCRSVATGAGAHVPRSGQSGRDRPGRLLAGTVPVSIRMVGVSLHLDFWCAVQYDQRRTLRKISISIEFHQLAAECSTPGIRISGDPMARIDTLYLIHHSHTDIGYTHDQPIVFDLHERFISEALLLAERYAGSDSDGAFRWTVENTYVLHRWLQHASTREIERFQAMERAGRIEVTAMFANLTPLLDTDELIESLQLAGHLRRDYGFTITSAMNCDVNGENWPLVDLLLDAGVEGFTMAINTHFGGAPLARPDAFRWQGPSGRSILAYSGWPYDQGWRYGIGRSHDEFEQVWWPRVAQRLDDIDYPLPVVMVQSYHPFGDNGSAFDGFVEWIDQWNATGQGTAHPVRHAAPVVGRGQTRTAPTCPPIAVTGPTTGTSARPAAPASRRSTARAACACARPMRWPRPCRAPVTPMSHPWLERTLHLYRQAAWENLIFWDEHTWGADISIAQPDERRHSQPVESQGAFCLSGAQLQSVIATRCAGRAGASGGTQRCR